MKVPTSIIGKSVNSGARAILIPLDLPCLSVSEISKAMSGPGVIAAIIERAITVVKISCTNELYQKGNFAIIAGIL